MRGILGKKLGMTQAHDAEGRLVAVTVIEIGPCAVVQRKTKDNDGYDAVQVGFVDQKPQRLSKASQGRFKKAGATAKKHLREFELDAGEDVKPGENVTAAIFDGVTHVDVIGITKGQGFQGVVKRHNMGGGPASHGHMSHRRIGAIGQRTWPARIMKNKRMPGHMGNVRVTKQNLKVIQLRTDDNAILVKGAIPGPTGAIVVVRKAVKIPTAAKAAK
jgi:large subunit ribosomal protein L3